MADNLAHHNNPLGQVVTIDVLSDDVLLTIFDFCVFKYQYLQRLKVAPGDDDTKRKINWWQPLVHVCRRWRGLIFDSPRRLNLQLQVLYVPGIPARKSLDVWPALPLLIHGDASETPMDNVIAELEHSDRICQISLDIHTTPQIEVEKLWAAMQVPFPELEILILDRGDGSRTGMPALQPLPDSFLGGSAPRLRYLKLMSIPLLRLPNLLMSATHLVHLSLCNIPDSGYISPNAMANCLSILIGLKGLLLGIESPQSSPDQENRRLSLPILSRSILPALTRFWFIGASEYLEELVARIDTPRLKLFSPALFHHDINFDVPELIRLASRSSIFKAPNEIVLYFDSRVVAVKLLRQASKAKSFLLTISGITPGWQLSSLTQFCTSSSDLLSTTESLFINETANLDSRLDWKDGIENIEWLELLLPFRAVKNLYICEESVPCMAAALQEISESEATEVLPNLQNIKMEGPEAFKLRFERFISGRRLINRPVAISVWDDRVLSPWYCYD